MWQGASSGREELIVALRVFATGIDYLQTNDEGVLLDLAREEREVLRQALELDAVEA